jgi:hypothetical protein
MLSWEAAKIQADLSAYTFTTHSFMSQNKLNHCSCAIPPTTNHHKPMPGLKLHDLSIVVKPIGRFENMLREKPSNHHRRKKPAYASGARGRPIVFNASTIVEPFFPCLSHTINMAALCGPLSVSLKCVLRL